MKASVFCGIFVLGCSATLNAQQHQLYRNDIENKASLAHHLAEDIYEIEGQLTLDKAKKHTTCEYQVVEADLCNADVQDLVALELRLEGRNAVITQQDTVGLLLPKAMLEQSHDGKITFHIKKEGEDKIEVTATIPEKS